MQKSRFYLVILVVLLLVLGSLNSFALAEEESGEKDNFIEICRSGTPEEVLAAIKDGANLDQVTENGMTPFLIAAKYNPYPDVIILLRNKGANTYYRNENGWTALMYASAYNSNPSVIEVLTYLGRDIDMQNKNGDTALLIAVKRGRKSAVRTLIRNGAGVNIKNDAGVTSLKVLFTGDYSSYDYSIFRMLVDSGANLNVRYEKGRTILYQAIDKGKINAVKILLENGAEVNSRDDNGITPLIFSFIDDNRYDIIEELIDYGAEIEAEDDKERTALSYAASYDEEIEKFDLLFKNGADINKSDKQGRTPLFYAVKENDLLVIRYLIEKGAIVNLTDGYGRTPLFYAVKYREDPVFTSVLINNGADLARRSYQGKTAMIYAVRYNSNPEVIRILMNNGANPIARDNSGKKVVDYLEENEALYGTDLYWDLNYLEPEKEKKDLLDLKSKKRAGIWAAAIPSAGHIYAENWWPKGTGFMVGELVVLGAAYGNEDNRGVYLGVFAFMKAFEIFDARNETEKLNDGLREFNEKVRDYNEGLDN